MIIIIGFNAQVSAKDTMDNTSKTYGLFISELISKEISKAISEYYGYKYAYSIHLKKNIPFELQMVDGHYEYTVTVMPHKTFIEDKKIIEDIKGIDTITFEIQPAILLANYKTLGKDATVPIKVIKYEHKEGFKEEYRR